MEGIGRVDPGSSIKETDRNSVLLSFVSIDATELCLLSTVEAMLGLALMRAFWHNRKANMENNN